MLIGIGLVQWQGWLCADPVAALLIVPYVAWEAYKSGRDAVMVNVDKDTSNESRRQHLVFAGDQSSIRRVDVVQLASLWAAIASDMGASLLVIANGLRLLRN